MSAHIKKGLIIFVLLAIGLAALPVTNAYATGSAQENTPPQKSLAELRTERLERIWAQQQRTYGRISKLFDGSLETRFQAMIDKAQERGLDVTVLEDALANFQAAVKDAHPIYESGKGIINSQQGFDNDGKVTDIEKARETVQTMSEKLREIKDVFGGSLKNLREVFRQFREENWPSGRSSQDANGG